MSSARLVRRVLVALDDSAPSRAALIEAAALARGLHAELSAAFVLEAEVLRVADLPCVRETCFTTGLHRPLSRAALEFALRSQAARARAALEEAARRHGVTGSFALVEGQVVPALLAASADADVLALGIRGRMGALRRGLGSTVRALLAGATGSLLLLDVHRGSGSRIVLVHGGEAGAGAALDQALELARARSAGVTVVLDGPRALRAVLRERLAPHLAGLAGARVIDFEGHAAGLATVARREDCGLLVLARDNARLAAIEDLLAHLHRPVLCTAERAEARHLRSDEPEPPANPS